MAKGIKLQSTVIGTVEIPLSTSRVMNAHGVVHVPDLTLNLLSVVKIASHEKNIVCDLENCSIINSLVAIDHYQVLATGTNENGMFRLDCV